MNSLCIHDDLAALGSLPGPLHLAIGMFDGLHLGHQAVIEAALHSAKRSAGACAVLSFWPHPSALMAPPERRTRMMMTPATRRRVLARLGVAHFVEQAFTQDFASIAAEQFPAWLKARLPRLASVYVGENWRFGAGRSGDVGLLLQRASELGFSVFSAPRVQFNGEPISSSRIRACLATGDLSSVNSLLGYNYFCEGATEPGRQLGRTLGFPTLNLPWDPELAPARGVYAVRVAGLERGEQESWFPAVANYGVRPTVEGAGRPLLECHLLGDCPFNYGDQIQVEWLRFVRPEKRFSNLQELKVQIDKDTLQVREDFRLQGSL